MLARSTSIGPALYVVERTGSDLTIRMAAAPGSVISAALAMDGQLIQKAFNIPFTDAVKMVDKIIGSIGYEAKKQIPTNRKRDPKRTVAVVVANDRIRPCDKIFACPWPDHGDQ
jgi:hypothetical protein